MPLTENSRVSSRICANRRHDLSSGFGAPSTGRNFSPGVFGFQINCELNSAWIGYSLIECSASGYRTRLVLGSRFVQNAPITSGRPSRSHTNTDPSQFNTDCGNNVSSIGLAPCKVI